MSNWTPIKSEDNLPVNGWYWITIEHTQTKEREVLLAESDTGVWFDESQGVITPDVWRVVAFMPCVLPEAYKEEKE